MEEKKKQFSRYKGTKKTKTLDIVKRNFVRQNSSNSSLDDSCQQILNLSLGESGSSVSRDSPIKRKNDVNDSFGSFSSRELKDKIPGSIAE